MSDPSSTPPPKAKPGSLRDRIAAFEKAAPAPAAAPPPRPKPGGLSWKPKAPSPPSSPSAVDHGSSTERKIGGMSASDAKESIGKGSSLKERMAALQGRGGFGAPPPVAPKPAVERPKWKPPPVVSPPVEDEPEATGEGESSGSPSIPARSAESPVVKPEGEDEVESDKATDIPEKKASEEEEGTEEVDAEAEERQRRAAIAARMARLGGARLGMGAPVFGAPGHKKPDTPKEEKSEAPLEEAAPAESTSAPDDTSLEPPAAEGVPAEQVAVKSDAETQSETPETKKSLDAASLHSIDSSPVPAPRTPGSMPVPAGPRRAAPPRKKPAKPPTSTPSTEEIAKGSASETTGPDSIASIDTPANEPPVGEKPAEKVEGSKDEFAHPPDAPASPARERQSSPPPVEDEEAGQPGEDVAEEPVSFLNPDHPAEIVDAPEEMQESPEDKPDQQASYDPKSLPPGTSEAALTDEPSPAPEQEPEVEDDAARRKRVAERLAKMGGVNPFAPPQRKPSLPVEEQSSQSPTVQKRASSKRDSVGSVQDSHRQSSRDSANVGEDSHPVPPPPARRSSQISVQSQRKSSLDSSTVDEEVRSIPDRRSSQLSAKSARQPSLESTTLSDSVGPTPPPRRSSQSSTQSPSGVQESDSTSAAHLAEDIDSPTKRKSLDEDRSIKSHVRERDFSGIAEEPESLYHDEPESFQDVDKESTQPHRSSIEEPEENPLSDQVPEDDSASDYGDGTAESLKEGVPPPRSLPPPPPPVNTRPRIIPELDVSSGFASASSPEGESPIPSRRSIPSPPHIIPHATEEDHTHVASPRRMIPPPPFPAATYPPEEAEADFQPLPPPHQRTSQQRVQSDDIPDDTPEVTHVSRPRRSIPSPPPQVAENEEEESAEERVLPTPPRRSLQEPASPVAEEEPLAIPPRVSREVPEILTTEEDDFPESPLPTSLSDQYATDIAPEARVSAALTPTLSVSDRSSQEILDEEEGDPIDPSFHSPSRRTSTADLRESAASQPSELQLDADHGSAEPEVDPEQERRRTIAERMAKLGGIRFGAAPLPTSRPLPRKPEESSAADSSNDEVEPTEHSELTEEEEERARKERIAVKLASMGGMRIGMMPLGVGMLQKQPSHVVTELSTTASPPPHQHAGPPARAPPPPRPQESDSEQESQATSEDVVKVEAEDSELEDVDYEDARETEEVPPPVPSRAGKRTSISHDEISSVQTTPSVPSGRPPVPTGVNRRASVQTTSSRRASTDTGDLSHGHPRQTPASHKSQSDYVMVEEPRDFEDSDVPPPPPARPTSRAPPPRGIPPLPAPAAIQPSDSISSQWELPSIPTSSLNLDGGTDLQMSWTEDDLAASSTSYDPPPPPPEKPTEARLPKHSVDDHLSSEELMAVWGRVGVQICEVATSLFERSKKSLIGDGTYRGFVQTALNEVPTAAAPSSSSSYGYLVYMQSGTAVQKRASDIMPGDVIFMHEAKLKGHKGIHTYSQNVGAGDEPLVGIVGEFEAKKFKVRVFHANQHVGQQTVESVSYRLEDLKSGVVKVFRVLEA